MEKSKKNKKSSTRIYNRFEYWTVEDCACIHCVNYKRKNTPCPLKTCSIGDIKKEAARREESTTGGILI